MKYGNRVVEKKSSKDRKKNENVSKRLLYKKWQEKEIIRLQYGWMKKN